MLIRATDIINVGIIAAVALLTLVPAVSAHLARQKTTTTNLVMAGSGVFIAIACVLLIDPSRFWIGLAVALAIIVVSGGIAVARVRYGSYGDDEE